MLNYDKMEAYIVVNDVKIDAYQAHDIYYNKYYLTKTPIKVSFAYEDGYGKCDLEIIMSQENKEEKIIILNTTEYNYKKAFYKLPTTIIPIPKEFLDKEYMCLKISLRSLYN